MGHSEHAQQGETKGANDRQQHIWYNTTILKLQRC